jgi:CheY-like chemotaxis protein
VDFVTQELGHERGKEDSQSPDTCFLLNFSITDTGPGIAPNEIKTIFEPFGQTELGRYTEQGAGLGLPISRKFVQLMGGEITVVSEPGRGSTFNFSIQVDRVEPETLTKPEPKLTRRITRLEPGQPHYRVLVVDDNLENRQLLVELLTPVGFDLREASNGQEAVEIWAEWQPHLIWMDVRMPVMDGYMATRQIKSTPQGRQTVIIAITASVFEEEQAIALEAGCNDFIRKPFREVDVFDLMRRYLGLRYLEEVWDEDTGLTELRDEEKSAIDWTLLPPELPGALEQAALRIDVEEVANLIQMVRRYNSSLADILAELANKFQYDEIVALLERRLR